MTTHRLEFLHRRSTKIILIVLLLFVVLWLLLRNNAAVGAFFEAVTPPELPPRPEYEQRVWLDQNWDREVRQEFHNITQGTRTLPVPLSWFLALEQPRSNVFLLPFGSVDKFADQDYLLRFGFIEGEQSSANPHGLPVGFATVPYQSMHGINDRKTGIGFTCAACHTGHMIYDDTEYVIEGGPATTDLGQLTEALGAALGQTLFSSKVPGLGGRFERFAQNVLGDAYFEKNKTKLANELEAVVERLATRPDEVHVVEGFSRLDALNRIGNQVFAWDTERYDNYSAINAPVTYPHIWTTSWFNWVQYDGSIMQPLVRNAGQALGVSAYLNTTAPKSEKRFSSSVPVDNLYWIEKTLSGEAPYPQRRFSGLLAPNWPDSFPAIDAAKAEHGAQLYAQHCEGCHLPPLNSDEIWSDNYFRPVTYYVNGDEQQTPEALLQLKLIALEQVGTDPAQANVLKHRTLNTAGEKMPAIGIDTEVCTWEPAAPQPPSAQSGYEFQPTRLVNVPISDGPNVNYGLALGGLVQQVTDEWFGQNYISDTDRPYFEGLRPNCLQVGRGYKARPLNGVWATAPFLHNGSVPTIMDVLSPPQERPTYVKLGAIGFDPVNVGLVQDEELEVPDDGRYDDDGYFILDTSLPGNSNRGHEFSSEWDPNKHYLNQKRGVIGPELTPEERLALIEFISFDWLYNWLYKWCAVRTLQSNVSNHFRAHNRR